MKKKLHLLEEEFTTIFNRLNRKGDLIERILVDPSSIDIRLYEKSGKMMNQNSLSAGEAEIYSISMLWALARISGKKLPFVIDTPLGRLDSSHRGRLVRDFFPSASHQTVIFSTDTEVDRGYFNDLRPFVSRAYQIVYKKIERQSTIESGYFWS